MGVVNVGRSSAAQGIIDTSSHTQCEGHDFDASIFLKEFNVFRKTGSVFCARLIAIVHIPS